MFRMIHQYKFHFTRKEYYVALFRGLTVFLIGMTLNMYAIAFAAEHASNPVTDLILSNVPVVDVNALFVYGTFVFTLIAIWIGAVDPKRIPFMLAAAGLFFAIRALFVSLTHTAPFETQAYPDFGERITHTFFGADLFFSGHTGLPFLGALLFWDNRVLRYLFLATTAFFAIIVLLGHLHYSIDVLSAFFITYGILHIAQYLFPKEYTLLRHP